MLTNKDFIKNFDWKSFLEKEYFKNNKTVIELLNFIFNNYNIKISRYSINKVFKKFNIRKKSQTEIQNNNKIKHRIKEINELKYGSHFSKTKEFKEAVKNTSLKKYGETAYSKTKECKEKYKKTNLEKYGVDNPSKLKEVKQKKKDTLLKNYGVDSFVKTDEYKRRYKEKTGYSTPFKNPAILEKGKQTTKERYGDSCIFKTSFYKEKYGNSNYSKISQKLFKKIYDNLNENLQEECYFASLNQEYYLKIKNDFFYIDFVLKNIAIEFYGDYWHCNPLKYDSLYFNESLNKTAEEVWKNDYDRLEKIKSKNFIVLKIWESDFQKDLNKVVTDCLLFIQENINYGTKR